MNAAALVLFAAVVLAIWPVGQSVGDSSEYYTMVFSIARFHRPYAGRPALAFYERYVDGWSWIGRGAALTVAAPAGLWVLMAYEPGMPEGHCTPSRASTAFYAVMPALYDPIPEIFLERNGGFCEAAETSSLWAVSSLACRKIIVVRRNLPSRRRARAAIPGCADPSIDPEAVWRLARRCLALRPDAATCYLDLADRTARRTVFRCPRYSPGKHLVFSQPTSEGYLQRGWSVRESWGRWSDGPEATLCFRLAPSRSGAATTLVLHASVLVAPGRSKPTIDIDLNGKHLGTLAPAAWESALYRFPVPPAVMSGTNRLRFVIHDPPSPRELGLSAVDERRLGLGFEDLVLE